MSGDRALGSSIFLDDLPTNLEVAEGLGMQGVLVEADPGPALAKLRLLDPLGYLDFLRLMAGARVVLTDSGGIQEETTILRVPCLTLRENTERPITVEMGTNQIVGQDPERIVAAYRRVVDGGMASGRIPPLWDGCAAERIVEILVGAL